MFLHFPFPMGKGKCEPVPRKWRKIRVFSKGLIGRSYFSRCADRAVNQGKSTVKQSKAFMCMCVYQKGWPRRMPNGMQKGCKRVHAWTISIKSEIF